MNRTQIALALGALVAAGLPSQSMAEIDPVDPMVAEGRALLDQRKITEAGDRFKAACDRKVGEGCYWQARVVRDYRYAPATLEAHYALKEKSCSLKFGQGCFSIAIDYRSGSQGLQIDKAKGNAFMQKSCDYGWGSGCGALASDYQYGFNAIAKDEAKAVVYFRKGCDARQPSPEACRDLASVYAEGTGTERNLDLALEAIEKAYKLKPEDRHIQTIARILLVEKEKQGK